MSQPALPSSTFSSMAAFSYQIVDSGLGAQFGFTPDRKPGRYDPSDLRVRVFNIAEKHAALGRSLDTGRHLAELKPLPAEGALFHYALGSRGILSVFRGGTDHLPGIKPVETSRAEGTGCHAVPASDTSMLVLHHDSIRRPKRCLGRANADAGRIVAMVA